MECSICYSMMNGNNQEVNVVTICGHVYHSKCLKDCLKIKNNCPQCQQSVNNSQFFQIYLDIKESAFDSTLLMTRLSDITDALSKRDQKDENITKFADSTDRLTMSMSSLEHRVEVLKKENAELKTENALQKELLQTTDGKKSGSKAGSSLKEELKVKDFMITNLQKEVSDLKIQRANTSKELEAIRSQVKEIKAAAKGEPIKRDPLRDVNGATGGPQSLTIRFDDFNDKIIIE